MFPGYLPSRRELTPVRVCSVRLSWRHRARPSTTLHEIQICPKADWNNYLYHKRVLRRKQTATPSCAKGHRMRFARHPERDSETRKVICRFQSARIFRAETSSDL